jgi:hypothetical protein
MQLEETGRYWYTKGLKHNWKHTMLTARRIKLHTRQGAFVAQLYEYKHGPRGLSTIIYCQTEW